MLLHALTCVSFAARCVLQCNVQATADRLILLLLMPVLAPHIRGLHDHAEVGLGECVIQSDKRTVQKDKATGCLCRPAQLGPNMLCPERQNSDGDGVGQIGGLAEEGALCGEQRGILWQVLVAKVEYTILCIHTCRALLH